MELTSLQAENLTQLIKQKIEERLLHKAGGVIPAPTPTAPAAGETCTDCINRLLEAARASRYKLLEFLLRAEAECIQQPEVKALISAELDRLRSDERLLNLCETVRNMLGANPR